MPGLVVDASVSAAWFLPAEATLFTESVLQATAATDVWVPALWLLEIGNLMLSAQRRKRIDERKRRELVVAAAAALRLRACSFTGTRSRYLSRPPRRC